MHPLQRGAYPANYVKFGYVQHDVVSIYVLYSVTEVQQYTTTLVGRQLEQEHSQDLTVMGQ